MNTCGLPATLAPKYQECFASHSTVTFASSWTVSVHSRMACAEGSIVSMPLRSRWPMQSVIQSTCCSMATGMLVSTEGLPGPVIVNRFGKPGTCRPR